jgi:hypothetical protein
MKVALLDHFPFQPTLIRFQGSGPGRFTLRFQTENSRYHQQGKRCSARENVLNFLEGPRPLQGQRRKDHNQSPDACVGK